MEGVGDYFIELDVLAPSFLMAAIVGFIVSKVSPPKMTIVETVEKIDK